MAQISNCLKLISKIDERDQDALIARLDELQAQGVPAERAQIQAAIDVLTGLQAKAAPAVRSAERPYGDAPGNLMGFRKSAPNTGFADQRYRHVEFVRVTWPDGRSMLEAQRGLNKPHALERARRNWNDAEVEAVSREAAESEDADLVREVDAGMASAKRSAARMPAGVEIIEVEDGFDAMKDGKRIGRLRDNLPRGAAEQLDENASVDIVKVEPEFKGTGVGSALYDAFNEKHGGRIAPSGKTSPEAWALWKRKFPQKVDAFIEAEAGRIRDGADPFMVMRGITDKDVARRVSEAAGDVLIRSVRRNVEDAFRQVDQLDDAQNIELDALESSLSAAWGRVQSLGDKQQAKAASFTLEEIDADIDDAIDGGTLQELAGPSGSNAKALRIQVDGVASESTRSRARQPSEIFGRDVAPLAIKAYNSLSPQAKGIIDGWNVNWSMGQERFRDGGRDSAAFDEVLKAYEPVREKLRQAYGDTIPAYRGEKRESAESKGDRFLFSWTPMRDIATGFATNRRRGLPPEITQDQVDKQVENYRKTGIARMNGYKFIRRDPGNFEPDGPDYYHIYRGAEMITDGDDIARALQSDKEDRDEYIAELRESGKLYTADIPVDAVAFIPVGANLRQPELVAEYNPRKDEAQEVKFSKDRGTDQTETPEFKAWFKDSKVTKRGKPLVVFHGTTGDFSAFDGELSNTQSRTGAPKSSFFFSDSPQVASSYTVAWQGDFTTEYSDDANVMPVYLSIQKPLKVNAKGESWRDIEHKGRFYDVNELAAKAQRDGYDGLIVSKVMDRGRGDVEDDVATTYVAFRPEQIKSAIGNSGSFDADGADITRSATRPEFYSQLQRAIEQVPDRLATMAAPQWKLWLDANAPKLGVKKDEIEWSGVKDYLTLRGKEKVTRDELAAFLSDNGVRIEETVLGATGLHDTGEMYVAEANDWGDEWAVFTEDGAIIGGTYETEGAAEQAMAEMQEEGKPSKYATYTVPGGENYREVLITLPTRYRRFEAKYVPESAGGTPGYWAVAPVGAAEVGQAFGRYTDQESAEREAKRRSELAASPMQQQLEPGQYASSHWEGILNILAHLRVDDRTDADGNKVLFINEIQSDFGQDYKKARDAIGKAVDADFQGIVDRMKAAGVLEVECD